jgi:hypothetical protein
MKKVCLLAIAITLSLAAIVQAQPNDLGMFKGRKRSELPDNYREINTPAKLKAFQEELETVPKNARITKIDGQTYHCVNRGGHDLLSGMKVSDMRCWQK